MSAVEIDQRTGLWARRLEDKEAKRIGQPLPVARQIVSRKLGIPAGTLENLRRGRVKGVRAWIADRIHAAVIRQIEAEIQGLEHERQMVMASLGNAGALEVQEIDASLAEIKALISGGRHDAR